MPDFRDYAHGKGTADFLAHTKKGYQKAGAKYISREWKNGRWVYKYKTSDGKIRSQKGQKSSKIKEDMADNLRLSSYKYSDKRQDYLRSMIKSSEQLSNSYKNPANSKLVAKEVRDNAQNKVNEFTNKEKVYKQELANVQRNKQRLETQKEQRNKRKR